MPCPSANYKGLSVVDWPYENWSKRVFGNVANYFEPDTVADLCNVVMQASQDGRELRVAGSQWGFENMTYSPASVVSIATMQTVVDDVIPSALNETWAARQRDPAGDKLVLVMAGTRVGNVTKLLAAHDPPLSLPTLGGANGQSFVGAFTTGTHGGDLQQAPLADMVVALQLITEGGRELWIERESDPITDDASLGAVLAHRCPDIEIVRSDALFNSVLVSVGRFGIVHACVVRARPAFKLAEWAFKRPWKILFGVVGVEPMLRQGILGPDLFRPLLDSLPPPPTFPHNLNADDIAHPTGLEVSFSTLTPEDCWVRRRWPIRPGADNSDFQVPNAGDDFCALNYNDVLKTVNDIFDGLQVSAAALTLINVAGGIITSVAFQVIRDGFNTELAKVRNPSQGDLLTLALNAMFDLDLRVIPEGISLLIFGERFRLSENGGRRGPADVIISGYPGSADNLCYRGDSIESIFDASQSGYLDYASHIMERLQTAKVAGWLSFRWSRPSKATLSMHNMDCPWLVAVELTSLRGLRGNEELMHSLEVMTLANGGRPHWGQINALTKLIAVEDAGESAKALAELIAAGRVLPAEFLLLSNVAKLALYGNRMVQWRQYLRAVVGNTRTFSCDYTRQRGLEPAAGTDSPTMYGVPANWAASGGGLPVLSLLL